MSQRTSPFGRAPATTGESQSQRRQERLNRVLIILGSIALMSAFAYDMLTGRWLDAAGLHVAAGLMAVIFWMPAARRVRHLPFALLYMFGLYLYTVLRSFADQTAIPIRAEYVIQLDRLLFFGQEPTRWLQERLFDPSRLGLLDWFTVQVHWSYFAVPHVAGAAIYFWRRELFPRFVVVVMGTFYVGLVLYFLLPTVPPWLAADRGILPGVSRVMDFVGGQVDSTGYARLYDAIGVPNPVAAMPSLHMAITFAVYLFARDINRWVGRVMFIYALAMGFSLIYMGEHYLTDVLVGALVAFVVYRLSLRVRRLAPATEHSQRTQ